MPVSDEKQFLENYDPSKYPPFAFTADIVLLTIKQGKLCVLLVERGGQPYQGSWAIPGGFVQVDESSETAASRELQEETGVDLAKVHLEQLGTYSAPDRDPRMRVVSTAYIALVPDVPEPEAGSDAAAVRFFPVHDLLNPADELDKISLAFDHEQILRDGVERTAAKLEYTPLATTFLDEVFTLADLRRVYEEVWNRELHAANFRRKILSTQDLVEGVGAKGESLFDGGKTAQLYRRGAAKQLQPALLRDESG